MADLIVLLVFVGLGIGGLLAVSSLIVLVVGMCTTDKYHQRNRLILAGKLFLAGILLFAVGFGSCMMVLSGNV